MNFFESQFYNEKETAGFRTLNPFGVQPSSRPAPKVNTAGNNNPDVGTCLARGVTAAEEVGAADNENNFFMTGMGVSSAEVSAVDVQNMTQRISGFKVAYTNFTSFPTKDSAQALKDAYLGQNGDSPIDNNSVRQLYEMKEAQVEQLLAA